MIRILATIGVLLSLYALWVTHRAKRKNYHAFCDIRKNISCTRAFTSPEGSTLGIHNSMYGLAFYLILLLLAHPLAVLTLATLGLAKTGHLAYISYVRMRNFCVVCTGTYCINILLFISAVRAF